MSHYVIEELEKIVKGRKSIKVSRDGDFISASVVVILREERGEYSMLFIKRREYVNDLFSGHMAFPGGKMQKGDGSKLETAIRETLEETGIDLKKNEEVAEFVWIPLLDFRNEKLLEIRVIEKYGMKLEDFTFRYQNYVIWGMTARILHQFLSLAGHLF